MVTESWMITVGHTLAKLSHSLFSPHGQVIRWILLLPLFFEETGLCHVSVMNLCELISLQICGAVYGYNSLMASQGVVCWCFGHGDQLFYLFKAMTKRRFHGMEWSRCSLLEVQRHVLCHPQFFSGNWWFRIIWGTWLFNRREPQIMVVWVWVWVSLSESMNLR